MLSRSVSLSLTLSLLLLSCAKSSKKSESIDSSPVEVCRIKMDTTLLDLESKSLFGKPIEDYSIAALPKDEFRTSSSIGLSLILEENDGNQTLDSNDTIVARVPAAQKEWLFAGEKIYLQLGKVTKREVLASGIVSSSVSPLLRGGCVRGETINLSSMEAASF